MKENKRKIGFLGPSGTYAEEAASKIDGELIPFESIMEVMEALKQKNVNLGVIPIENSIEGSVGLTLDLLVHDYDLKIIGEIILPISHKLLINPKSGIEDIETVYSHGQALSQCRKFIENMNFKPIAASSTSMAAEMARGQKNAAAIGTGRAADLYGLKIAAENIQDYDENLTRFIILGRHLHEPTGHDKTSIVFSMNEDRPGGLYEVLGAFAKCNVNLTKIESRPSKKKLGKYIFFIDFQGHTANIEVKNILNSIKNKVSYVKILGSYPIEGDDEDNYGKK
ncbi:MAG: prephenate dehydratase [Methanobacterium sp.]